MMFEDITPKGTNATETDVEVKEQLNEKYNVLCTYKGLIKSGMMSL
jgi:hypothetical protein